MAPPVKIPSVRRRPQAPSPILDTKLVYMAPPVKIPSVRRRPQAPSPILATRLAYGPVSIQGV
jgi:hypothetical protein